VAKGAWFGGEWVAGIRGRGGTRHGHYSGARMSMVAVAVGAGVELAL